MITHGEVTTVIQCDKCKREDSAPNECYNDIFWEDGWALNKGRKHMHLCRNCLPKASREAMDWYKQKFPK